MLLLVIHSRCPEVEDDAGSQQERSERDQKDEHLLDGAQVAEVKRSHGPSIVADGRMWG
ncbi:hypothetical protein GCM10011584_18550 [Nocardioides phosphati]|uniref:Uncharacterized protein n=1 Tax=Nocardioides phosphati TaxID=1867775 RepID=A0ABQ2NA11_9ACTN|nr:hypothetical protein GCM10011584_18550 [Nocardioides phosphati]